MFRLRLKPVEQWLSALVSLDTSYWRHHYKERILCFTLVGGGDTADIASSHYINTHLSTIPTSNSKLYR